MAYVAVKGGERRSTPPMPGWPSERRGDPAVPELEPDQIAGQLGRAVDRVMAEGSLFDRGLAALAIKQAQGDLIEAAFLLRAYRTTLPRFAAASRWTRRRWRCAPGLGDLQGPARRPGARPDLRLHPPPAGLRRCRRPASAPAAAGAARRADAAGHRHPGPRRADRAGRRAGGAPVDLTREPLAFPAGRRRGCRRWPAATRASCWRSATPPSAARAAPTPSWASCAWATVAVSSSRRSWASPSTSATSR